MNNISGIEIVKIKKDGNSRIQVEQDGFVVASNLTEEQALNLAVKLQIQHENRNTS